VYARTTTIEADPDRMDEGIDFVRRRVAEAVREHQGSAGLSMLVDRASGRAIVVTGWDSREAMRASEGALAPMRTEWSGVRADPPPQVQEWEVVVLHRLRPPEDGQPIRSTWVELDPADVDGAIEAFRTGGVPALEVIPGFVSATLLVDREAGQGISSVVFENEDALVRSREPSNRIRAAVTEKAHARVREVAELELAVSGLVPPE
jgi:heme-degrading monooxygenase HmoA